jgi:hypothetical protein
MLEADSVAPSLQVPGDRFETPLDLIAFCEPLFIGFSHSASECLRPAIILLISFQLAITRRVAARCL